MNAKQALREQMRSCRKGISIIEMSELSARVCMRILEMDKYRAAKRVLAYASVNNEVSLRGLIRQMLDEGKEVYLPVVRDRLRMDAVRVYALDDLKKGAFNVLEPTGGEVIAPQELDLALVPGMAFDRAGYRLGYGSGYYDRFLSGCGAFFVGVAYEKQIVDQVPYSPHDRKMHAVVTERACYDCLRGY